MESNSQETLSVKTGDMLLVVDMQNDFLPGGALGVTEGDVIVGPANCAIELFQEKNLPVFFSRDWHPADHSSFQQHGGPWPPHCIENTKGAAFAATMVMPENPAIFSKGTRADREEYSAFHAADETGKDIRQTLTELGIGRVWICGLATDYCVLNTALDLLKAGYQVVVLTDACRAVNVAPDDGEKAIGRMIAEGAQTATAQALGKRS